MRQTKILWYVLYCGNFIDKTWAVSADKAINNVRWNLFLSEDEWADWNDFDAVEA